MRTRLFLSYLTAAAGVTAMVLAACSTETPVAPAARTPKPSAAEVAFKNEIRPLLMRNCGSCHGPDVMKSGIRVDLLDGAFRDQHLALWRDIANQLEEESMPPEGKPQPTAAERAKLVKWIRDEMKAAQTRSKDRNGWSRRLTVPQYRNTLRDLLGLEDDLAKVLPGDGMSKDGFANDGASLQLSPLQMEYYLEIAGEALDLSMVDPGKPPTIQNFRLDFGRGIRPNPLKDGLVLGAGSHLLNNADFTIHELAAAKPFPFTPWRMQRDFDFIEGYAGNSTVRGMRHFSGLEHAVFACMRGTDGYPNGAAAYSLDKDGLLLRPAIPSPELFGQGNTMGPMANFKVSVRELPPNGLFRVKVTASRFEHDGLPLNPDTDPPEDAPGIRADFKDGRAALDVPDAGVYQVDLEHRPGGEGNQMELLLDDRSYLFQAKVGKKKPAKNAKNAKDARRPAENEIDIDGLPAFKFDAVTVTVPGHARTINLHEFQLMAGERNLAKGADVSSSSVYSGGDQFIFKHLVDGDLDNLAHSAEEDNPWFRLAFKAPQAIDAIRIWNRAGFESRFDGAEAVFTLDGKEVHRRKLVPDEVDREDALMLVRLDKGPLVVEARQGKSPIAIAMHRLPDGSTPVRDYEAFANRVPQLGVRVGFRRDCGSTLPPVAPPQPVPSGKPAEFVFFGAINNFPSPAQVENNPNYLAGMREIGVRSEYTDGRPMPRLRIHSVEFEGPYLETWPPAAHKAIFIDSPNQNDPPRYAKEILEAFMKRAYRRDPSAAEVALVQRVWAERFKEGGDFRASVKDALLVVLTSPQFLFISEASATPAPEPLTAQELAAKLSYFLWNTMPDARLREKADGGTLAGSLDAEVDRLLDDPRSAHFFEAFATQWLSLDKFDVVDVDRRMFPKMDRDTRVQLRREPAEYLRHMVAKNLPAENLIKSDFVVVNDVVAAYYGLADQSESGMAFHAVPAGASGRGGLLTQASILCGLSSGKESNPVKRGAWLARKIVAEPPGDPPPNVPTVKDDPAAKLTLRQRLEQHRNQPGCVKCHEKIDPWGVPFEEFDAIGMRKNPKGLDASSELPDGTQVAGFEALRTYLTGDHMDQVAYAFIKHLATYGLGRSLSFHEQDELKKQCLTLKPGGYKTRDMIHWLVKSDLFLKK